MFSLLSMLALGAIAFFFAGWFRRDGWLDHPVLMAVFTFVLIAQLGILQVPWWLLPRMQRWVPSKPATDSRLAAVVTFVPGVESLEMLEQTVVALVGMRRDHETWVLDEGDDDDVRALCHRLGAHHFTRKHSRHYRSASGTFKDRTKYGNVNAWLCEVGYDRFDFVANFDPDHKPRPEFLERVLPYFEDSRIGYVQAAQVYYNQEASFIARGAAEETYAYYSSLQMSSQALGYPIVTGCHNTHRVEALRQVGGFAAHDADDLLITLLYRAEGWEGVYVPEVFAVGLTPVNWNAYLAQQRRWVRSVLDIKLRIFPRLASKLPLQTRAMCFLHGLAYVQESLQVPISIGVLIYVLATGAVPLLSYLFTPRFLGLLAFLMVLELYRQRFFLNRKQEWGLHWRAVLLRFAKWPDTLGALVEAVTGQDVPYVTTRKTTEAGRRGLVLRAQVVVAVLIGAALVTGLIREAPVEPRLQVTALFIAAANLGIFLSQWLPFPPPYDPDLQARFERRLSCGS